MAEHRHEGSTDRPGGWRLEGASSAYLRGAAEQPIGWYPWGPEPFAEAARRRRPILLDIGAVWCHWCHVMDEATYSDPEVARLIEQHFIAVKVDRDEHPEVDRRYQRQVGVLTGEGGWPLTAFLTPEGEVFLGGTYFPPQDAVGRPGFRRVLKEVARLWREEPERISANAEAVREAMGRLHAPPTAAPSDPGIGPLVRRDLEERADPVNGGFGQAPKFPHPTALSFLLLEAYRTGTPGPAELVRRTLERMADGGMYDQVGGGFHRYSVDEGWHIPHFEKMGVDNAALLDAYTEGARRFGAPRFAEVITETYAWSRKVLGDPAGGFGASQDADNAPGDDGSYFTWTRGELKEILDPESLRLVVRFFGVGTDGRMPHDPDRNVLFRLLPLEEAGAGAPAEGLPRRLEAALAQLRAAREQRPSPTIDHALYAQINGTYLRALAHAGPLVGSEEIVRFARTTADRFLAQAYRPGRGLAHRLGPEGPSGFGQLDDQAEFALGLVELGAATADPRYLNAATEVLETILREFPGEDGLLRDLAPALYDGPTVGTLSTPSYPLEDAPHLAANAATALALVRVAALTGEDRWRESAQSLISSMSRRLAHAGLFAASTALAAGLLDLSPVRVVIEGEGAEADALWHAAVAAYHPLAYVFRGTPPAPFSLPGEAGADRRGPARALVCFGARCLAPITEPASVAAALGAPPTPG
jgi:hypothetical protein